MFVSIHIPKTAGTYIGQALDLGSGRRVFFDYDSSYTYHTDVQPIIRENLPFITSYFRAIHGHFYYTKYSDLLPDAKYITCVRHPVDRIVSQYMHVAYDPSVSSWQTEKIRSGEMNVVGFARSDGNIRSAMSNHLRGRRVADYDFVFLSEKLAPQLVAFSRLFSFPIFAPEGRINTGSARQTEAARARFPAVRQVTEDEKRQVFGLCEEDVELYVSCKELVAQRGWG